MHNHRFDPKNMQRLDNPERQKMLPPDKVLRTVGVREGMTFLDIGAGTGYFSFPAAAIAGPNGSVIAADCSPEMIAELNRRSRERGVAIRTVQCEADTIALADNTADIAFMGFMLHEVNDQKSYLAEVRRVLKRGGMIAVAEWKKIKTEMGPPVDERLSEDDAKALLTSAGFQIHRSGELNNAHYYVTAVTP